VNTLTISRDAVQLAVLNLCFVFLLKALCLTLSYLTIRLGFQLFIAGAKGDFKFSGAFAGAKADLASVSPGLLFVLLAIALAAYAIGVDKVTTFEHQPAGETIPAPDVPLPPTPSTTR
jgi:hypothetical protein